MPRYYIDKRINEALEADTEGVELADDGAARERIRDALPDTLRSQLEAGDHRPVAMAARDGAGIVIYRMTLVLEEELPKRSHPD